MGDSGKTFVSLGLLLALKKQSANPIPFKKGPDFIDAAWLGWAAGRRGRNLDVYMMGEEKTKATFLSHADPQGINVIEGNRGLFDGFDAKGSFSTAELAKLLRAPTILVFSIPKMTRTAAAMVLGLKNLDPEHNLAGVILNLVGGARHRRVATEAIEQTTGIPVVGAIPRYPRNLLPSRHLGLVTLAEHRENEVIANDLGDFVAEHVDLQKIIDIANQVESFDELEEEKSAEAEDFSGLKIGVLQDSAFTFYYPENLEAIEKAGAEIVRFSALDTAKLPEIDGLYIGGGFPETHLPKITGNRSLLNSIKEAADQGLTIYAECGGLMLLTEKMEYKGRNYELAGVFPITLNFSEKPQGHGYCEIEADQENPFFPVGKVLKGHEFHYSGIASGTERCRTTFKVKRGTGCFDKRDGLLYKNVLAGYTHLHEVGSDWSKWFLGAVKRNRARLK